MPSPAASTPTGPSWRASASSSGSRSRARGSSRPSSTRCRRRTSTCRRSSSPTTSWPPCGTALSLLTDGGFAYAEPLRLALQQVAWGHPNPLGEAERAPVEMAMTASAGGRDLSQRLSKIETAISRRKTIEFTYYTMERDDTAKRKVDPFHLVFRGGQFYLIGSLARARRGPRLPPLADPGQGRLRVQGRARLHPARGLRPPRLRASAPTGSSGSSRGTAKIFVRDRIAWLIERDFGDYGSLRPATQGRRGPRQGQDLRDRVRQRARADRLGPALAPERQGPRRPDCAKRPRPAWRCCATATRTASSRPRPSIARCAGARAARAPTAAARRRSGPSASPASSPSPGS